MKIKLDQLKKNHKFMGEMIDFLQMYYPEEPFIDKLDSDWMKIDNILMDIELPTMIYEWAVWVDLETGEIEY